MSVSDDGSPGPSQSLDTVSYILTLHILSVCVYIRSSILYTRPDWGVVWEKVLILKVVYEA